MMFFSHSQDDSKFCTVHQRSAGLEADFCIMLNLGELFAWSKRGVENGFVTLRIQVCPKEGNSPIILFLGMGLEPSILGRCLDS